ncbi:Na(+)-translocating NADH-quinone reductase subunit F [Winogradskyella vincentii]|uniref:Na(+)-translocating NADH-quinone reductase subunit F n=1 Tax=Winogradskyella vincentii TaxID=2877122 RepID=A0ABS7XYX3_9FLAO|nr:Na(+)-translocating NADH-quinone reductase subunit F [Winogradskyella vincentii]MCA0151827.1 Na(+)-translocating NADH-quinone reductase subunit F [Winogradskyella vincentii]
MKTTKRFDLAIQKLYQAFHNNRLNPDDCKLCAVGNILDNNDSWKHLTDKHGSTKLNYLGILHQNLGRRFNGYSPLELLHIEKSFLKGCGYTGFSKDNRLYRPENITDKNILFNGLNSVVTYLCELDGIVDIMDCSKLFKFESQSLQCQD